MGGRGGYSGIYSGLSLDSLQSMLDRQEQIMARNHTARLLNPNSKNSNVRRRQAQAAKAYDAASAKAEELTRAISAAKKRKRAIPF